MNKYICDLSELYIQEKPENKIYLKPKYNTIGMLVMGFLLQFSFDWRLMGLGLFLIIMSSLNLKFGVDKHVADMYEGFIVLYDYKKANQVIVIPWDYIDEWRCYDGKQGADYFILKSEDEYIRFETFNSKKVSHYFWKIMPEREGRTIIIDRLKQSNKNSKWKIWYQNMFK